MSIALDTPACIQNYSLVVFRELLGVVVRLLLPLRRLVRVVVRMQIALMSRDKTVALYKISYKLFAPDLLFNLISLFGIMLAQFIDKVLAGNNLTSPIIFQLVLLRVF